MVADPFSVAPRRRVALLLLSVAVSGSAACAGAVPRAMSAPTGTATSGVPSVGPRAGTVMVVGGGAMGPEVLARFIAAAGGPEALIVDVPTAGGDSIDSRILLRIVI